MGGLRIAIANTNVITTGGAGGGGLGPNLLLLSGNNLVWLDGNNAIPESLLTEVDLSDMADNEAPSLSDAIVGVQDPGGSPEDVLIPFSALLGLTAPEPGGRLTGVSGDPAYHEEASAITTIYYTPFAHSALPLYDVSESAWHVHLFDELSIAVPATTDTNYDVFAYLNSGVLSLALEAWTDDSTRNVAVSDLNGRTVDDSDNSRLLLGTIRTSGVSGQVEDSVTERYISNKYNKIWRRLRIAENTSHTYTSASWRNWNNTTSGTRFHYVLTEVATIMVYSLGVCYETTGAGVRTGIGVDTSSDPVIYDENRVGRPYGKSTGYAVGRDEGYHYCQALEYGTPSGTTAFNVWKGSVELEM